MGVLGNVDLVLGVCNVARGEKRNGVEGSTKESCGGRSVIIAYILNDSAIREYIMNE